MAVIIGALWIVPILHAGWLGVLMGESDAPEPGSSAIEVLYIFAIAAGIAAVLIGALLFIPLMMWVAAHLFRFNHPIVAAVVGGASAPVALGGVMDMRAIEPFAMLGAIVAGAITGLTARLIAYLGRPLQKPATSRSRGENIG